MTNKILNVTGKIQKWGNSTGVRLPKNVLNAAHVDEGTLLKIGLDNGNITLSPIKQDPDISLKDILRDVTPDKVGGEYYWGGDVGKEIIDD